MAVRCAADHGWQWDDFAEEYVRKNNQFPEAYDSDPDTYAILPMENHYDHRYEQVHFHATPGTQKVTQAKIVVDCGSGSRVRVKVVYVTGTGMHDYDDMSDDILLGLYGVPTTLYLPLYSPTVPDDNLQIMFYINPDVAADNVYVYDTFFTFGGGQGIRSGATLIV